MAHHLHEKLRRVFDMAMEAAPADRQAIVDRECAGDEELGRRLREMLAAVNDDRFLGSPTADMPPPSGLLPADVSGTAVIRETPGTRIGPYKLLQLIGEGGFGSVFMAEQERPVQRKVALKIIKLGMDTRQVVARFEQERQALAILDHPHIAKVFDAGATETGRPFFVMELCTGEPIDVYCDRNQLSIKDRLELFTQVCSAVQHAHTKGLIHRDIKPGNVLVSTQDGRPSAKVIDFGIAKATASKLTERTLFTEHRQIIGTPAYMSPEQAEGSLDIDTRTDVYALGVMLYELLTGSTPFTGPELRSAAYSEIQRIIREVEPPAPSTRLAREAGTLANVAARRRVDPRKLGGIIRGDLDWIVMKALEKDRKRRYESPIALAEDIQRHLDHQPVSAGPPGTRYKAWKFINRHRGKVAAAGEAIEERDRADEATRVATEAAAAETLAKDEALRRLSQVEKGVDILASVFETLDPRENTQTGRPLQAQLAENLDNAIRELEGEAIADKGAMLRIQVRLGKSLLGLGEAEKAIAVYERACKASEEILGPVDPYTLSCKSGLAMAYGGAGKFDRAIPMLERLIKDWTDHPQAGNDSVAISMHNLALMYRQIGRTEEALPLLEKATALRRTALGPDHRYTLSSQSALATVYETLGRSRDAVPLHEATVEAFKRTLGVDHPSTLAAMNNLGSSYRATGKALESVELLEEVVRVGREKHGTNNSNTLAMMANLGASYQSAGKLEQAAAITEEALTLMRARHGNDYPNTMNTITSLGSMYWSLGRLDKSVPLFEEGLALKERRYGKDRLDTRLTAADLGVNYRDAGRASDALPLLEEAYRASANEPRLEYVSGALAGAYADLGMKDKAVETVGVAVARLRRINPTESAGLASGLVQHGTTLIKAGDGPGAESLLREALSIRESSQPDHWTTFNTRSVLGEALMMQKKYGDAEPLLVGGYEGLRACEAEIPAGAKKRLTEAVDRLIRLYSETNKPDEVDRYRAERAKPTPPAAK